MHREGHAGRGNRDYPSRQRQERPTYQAGVSHRGREVLKLEPQSDAGTRTGDGHPGGVGLKAAEALLARTMRSSGH